MDDFGLDEKAIFPVLRELETVNSLLGGYPVFYTAFKKIGLPEYAHISDWGCGGGDTLIRLAKWAKKTGKRIRFTGLDATASAVQYARKNTASYPEITIAHCDVMRDAGGADVVISGLFTHHFPDEDWIALVQKMAASARLAVVVNDLHRHPIAWWSIRLLTRLFSRSAMVRHDAPLSVLRAFRRKELEHLLHRAGIKNYRLRWMWAFRWQLIIFTGEKG